MKFALALFVITLSVLVTTHVLTPNSNANLSTSSALELEAQPQFVNQDKDQDKTLPGLTSNQALMRDKLTHMNRILEGLTLNNFDQVAESGETLAMISRATSWHIPEPTAKYQRLSKNFQEQSRDLERHAKERNIEAATLDLVRMNISCTDCHQHMREHLANR